MTNSSPLGASNRKMTKTRFLDDYITEDDLKREVDNALNNETEVNELCETCRAQWFQQSSTRKQQNKMLYVIENQFK